MNRPVPSAVRGRSHRPRTPVRAGRFRDDAPPLPRLHDAGRALVATALALLAIAFGTAGPGALAAAGPAEGSGFADLEAKVRSFTLPNGLVVIVLERPEAPVFAFRTFVDAGGVDEVAGITGLAHMFEHMAFKGTESFGSTDPRAEARALDAVDAAWDAWFAEKQKGYAADSTRLRDLEAAFKRTEDAAKALVVGNEFSKILDENGAVSVNAYTSMDNTNYFYALPANRLELWARLEGDRLTQPVMREYYKERDVVQEERRFGESSPRGRLMYNFWLSAFLAHPYGNGLIGHPSDLGAITRRDAEAFFREHYVAKNMAIAVVGDVRYDEVKRLAERYFSGISDAPEPPPVRTVEPRHEAEIRVVVQEEAQPAVMIGYHVPSSFAPEWPAVELLGQVVGSGRSSRLYERLVKRDQTAVRIGAYAGFPGEKYPNLLMVQASLARGASTDSVEAAIYEELDRLARQGPTEEELRKVKRQVRAGFIRGLRSNLGLAGQLATFQELYGDWRLLFRYVDTINAVTPGQVQAAAQEAFREGNRVVGVLRRPDAGREAPAGAPASRVSREGGTRS